MNLENNNSFRSIKRESPLSSNSQGMGKDNFKMAEKCSREVRIRITLSVIKKFYSKESS